MSSDVQQSGEWRVPRAMACLVPLRPLVLGCVLLSWGGMAAAAPLTFGEIGPDTRPAVLARLADCPAPAGDDVEASCTLRRRTFGGLDIRSSRLSRDEAGRPVALDIGLAAEDARIAAELLEGRYGPAQRSGDTLAWSGFDNGGVLTLAPRGIRTVIAFRFAAPDIAPAAAPAPVARSNPRPALYLLGLSLLGLLAGTLFLRRNRRPRVVAPPPEEPSMKATLEKRLRDGRGLEF